jgi:ATP-dependent DNA helicase RecQ
MGCTSASDTPDEIERLARARFGIGYLYPIQRFVVSNVLEGNPHIVVLPTGSGTCCFLLPSLMLKGATLVVVPLLSLPADQERKLRGPHRLVVEGAAPHFQQFEQYNVVHVRRRLGRNI